MACNQDFIEYICSQIEELGNVRYRKMFGDYMIYLNEKPVILACNNIAYVKKLAEIADLMQESEVGVPYDGAKEHYILDVGHKSNTLRIISILEDVVPFPRSKKK